MYILPDSQYWIWGSFSKCKFSGKLFKRVKGKSRGEKVKKEKGKKKVEREGKKEKGKREKGKR